MKKETMIDYIEEGVTQESDYFTIIIEDNDALVKRLAGDGIVEIVLLSELGKLLKIIIDQKLVLRFEMIEESPVRHTGGSADIADREKGIAFFL